MWHSCPFTHPKIVGFLPPGISTAPELGAVAQWFLSVVPHCFAAGLELGDSFTSKLCWFLLCCFIPFGVLCAMQTHHCSALFKHSPL